jgi:hypothetical protein
VIRVAKFEGYKVPECTEEEVRGYYESGDCITNGGDCAHAATHGCQDCLFNYLKDENKEAFQRYLDHRYPQKIAVHCKIQEEWDRVMKKAKSYLYDEDWQTFEEESCLDIAMGGYDQRSWFTGKGYKIISAEEYLGEEKKDSHALDALCYMGHTFNNLRGVTPTNEEEDMSASAIAVYIAEIYENLEDAILVYHYMGAELEQSFNRSFTRKLWLTDKKDEYLVEAKRLEEEANKD